MVVEMNRNAAITRLCSLRKCREPSVFNIWIEDGKGQHMPSERWFGAYCRPHGAMVANWQVARACCELFTVRISPIVLPAKPAPERT